jgi:hypothetical protein
MWVEAVFTSQELTGHVDRAKAAQQVDPVAGRRTHHDGTVPTMRLIRTLLAILAAVAAVLLTTPPVATAAATTPFKSEVTAQASLAETPVPGVLTLTGSGVGHASHLGNVSVSNTETLDFVTSPGGLAIRDGRMVMVAANGDELHWAYEGAGSLPDTQGVSAFSGTFLVTGGTGRFADATGSGTFYGTGDTVTGVANVAYHGTIAY